MRYVHEIKITQHLPTSIEEAWSFFSSPDNLAKITPPQLDFRIVSKPDSREIFEGMEIEYRVKPLLGIPVKWRSRLCRIQRPNTFTDIQLQGPYTLWEHTHTFTPTDNGVEMLDVIRYKVPMGFLGNLFHPILVRPKLNRIFKYRRETLEKIFQS